MSEPRHSEALGRKLTKDKAGDLVYWPPAGHGQPSSGSITIVRPGGGALPAPVSGAAMTVSSVSTGIAGDPSAGDREFAVDDAAGITPGRSYVLETGGLRERVVVRSVSGTTVRLRGQVRYDHTDATTLKGHRLSYTVAAANTATTDRNLHAAITWTDEDGDVHDDSLVCHVVRQPWRLTVTEEAVLRSWPAADAQRHVRDREGGFAHEIAEAGEEIALRYMRPAGYVEDLFLDRQPFGNLGIFIVRRILVEQLYANDPERLRALAEYWQERADAEWERLARALPAYDADGDGVIDAPGEEGIAETAALHLPQTQETADPEGIGADDLEPVFSRHAVSGRRSRTLW